MRTFFLALLCAAACGAQTYSSHSGWSFTDTTESMTDVVVGDIVLVAQQQAGLQGAVSVTVRVVRALQGELQPGAELSVSWALPAPPPGLPQAVTVPSQGTRGLWLLQKKGSSMEALRAATIGDATYFVQLPLAALPAAMAYQADLPVQSKIAWELAWAAQDLVTQHPGDLTMPAAGPMIKMPSGKTFAQYRSLTMALQDLDQKAALGALQYLSTQVEPNLKLLGLEGRLANGDLSAVFEIERDLPRLAATPTAVIGGPFSLRSSSDAANLPAMHAVARIGLSDATLQGWEGSLPTVLSGTHSVEFLPYLNAMLESPQSSVRDSVLMSYCGLLRPTAFWQEAMTANCPARAPQNDAEAERRQMAFWRGWYGDHLAEIRKVAVLPQVVAPARYSAPPDPTEVEVTMEMRFRSVIMQSRATADHYHDASGAMVAGPPPAHDMFGSGLNAADREVFHKIVDATAEKLNRADKAASDFIAAARTSGKRPDEQKLMAFEAEREAALKAGLFDLQGQLSAEGWKNLEAAMKSMGLSVHRVGMTGK